MKLLKNKENINKNMISHEEVRSLLADELKTSVMSIVQDLFKAEVSELCGSLFQRKNSELFHRAGSNPGSILLKGQRIKLQKPRVKSHGSEVDLNSYKALQSYDLLQDRVMSSMLHAELAQETIINSLMRYQVELG